MKPKQKVVIYQGQAKPSRAEKVAAYNVAYRERTRPHLAYINCPKCNRKVAAKTDGSPRRHRFAPNQPLIYCL